MQYLFRRQQLMHLMLAFLSIAPVILAAGDNQKDLQDAPEPAGFMLIGTGLIAVSMVGRRQKDEK